VKIPADDPRAVALSEAIRVGDLDAVDRLLAEHGELAAARFVAPRCGDERTPLHVGTDWQPQVIGASARSCVEVTRAPVPGCSRPRRASATFPVLYQRPFQGKETR
jgi:hypothetical protein